MSINIHVLVMFVSKNQHLDTKVSKGEHPD